MNDLHSPWERLQHLRAELKAYLKQREEVIDGALIALLANAHLLMLGPPGTAKSMLATTLCGQIHGAEYFQYWLNKFTTWKDLACGEVLVREEKRDGVKSIRFVNIEGKMLRAHIAVLDEIFKASIATAHALLPFLNERLYSINADMVKRAPILSVFAASNEMPGKEQDELRAFADRFLLRYEVEYISVSHDGDSDFIDMLEGTTAPPTTTLTFADLTALWEDVERTPISRGLLSIVNAIRATLVLQHKIQPSDRRYRDAKRAIRAQAVLNGHDEVELEDLTILEHILWTTRERTERETVRKVVHEVTRDPHLAQGAELFTTAQRVYQEALGLLTDAGRMVPFQDEHRRQHTRLLTDAAQHEKQLAEIYQQLVTLVEAAGESPTCTTLRTFVNEVNVLRKSLLERRGVENPFIEVSAWTQTNQA